MTLWYLSTPYTKYPGGYEGAFAAATKQSALLALAGVKHFCPIAHTHTMTRYMPEQTHEFWMDFDQPFMDKCDGLIVCKLATYELSKGMFAERQYFQEAGKPLVYMAPDTVPPECLVAVYKPLPTSLRKIAREVAEAAYRASELQDPVQRAYDVVAGIIEERKRLRAMDKDGTLRGELASPRELALQVGVVAVLAIRDAANAERALI